MRTLSAALQTILILSILSGCSAIDMEADRQGAKMSGPTAGSVVSHESDAGTISIAGQAAPPDNLSSILPDGTYLKSEVLPGTKIIAKGQDLIYDGNGDLRLDVGTVTFDPETGELSSIHIEGFVSSKSEPIRARNEGLAVIAEQTKALSSDQRAQIEAIAPSLIDGILELAKVAGI